MTRLLATFCNKDREGLKYFAVSHLSLTVANFKVNLMSCCGFHRMLHATPQKITATLRLVLLGGISTGVYFSTLSNSARRPMPLQLTLHNTSLLTKLLKLPSEKVEHPNNRALCFPPDTCAMRHSAHCDAAGVNITHHRNQPYCSILFPSTLFWNL